MKILHQLKFMNVAISPTAYGISPSQGEVRRGRFALFSNSIGITGKARGLPPQG
jgi:hypothetical protein